MECAPARTRNAPPIDDEQPIGYQHLRIGGGEALDEIPVMKPTHAYAMALEHPGPHQRKHPRADPDDRRAMIRGTTNERQRLVVGLGARMQEPAHNDDVVERLGFVEGLPRRQLDTAACPHRRERFADDAPSAPHGFAEIAVVGR